MAGMPIEVEGAELLTSPSVARITNEKANPTEFLLQVNLCGAELRPPPKEAPLRDDHIKRFIEADYARVVRAVTVACGDRERAEDAVQEAVVDAWAKRREVDDLAGWVTTGALNRARSRWRSLAAERRAFERLADRTRQTGPTLVETSLLDEQVARAMSALRRNQREVVALHYLLDMSVADVARRLGMAEGTAKVHLHRARHALKGALGTAARQEEIDRVRR